MQQAHVAKSLAGLQQLLLVVTYMASLSPSLEGIVDLSLYIQENARKIGHQQHLWNKVKPRTMQRCCNLRVLYAQHPP